MNSQRSIDSYFKLVNNQFKNNEFNRAIDTFFELIEYCRSKEVSQVKIDSYFEMMTSGLSNYNIGSLPLFINKSFFRKEVSRKLEHSIIKYIEIISRRRVSDDIIEQFNLIRKSNPAWFTYYIYVLLKSSEYINDNTINMFRVSCIIGPENWQGYFHLGRLLSGVFQTGNQVKRHITTNVNLRDGINFLNKAAWASKVKRRPIELARRTIAVGIALERNDQAEFKKRCNDVWALNNATWKSDIDRMEQIARAWKSNDIRGVMSLGMMKCGSNSMRHLGTNLPIISAGHRYIVDDENGTISQFPKFNNMIENSQVPYKISSQFKTITNIRNIFSWFLSYYNGIKERSNITSWDQMNVERYNFTDFIKLISDREDVFPCRKMIFFFPFKQPSGQIGVDWIFRLEHLSEDMIGMSKTMGWEEIVLPRMNMASGSNDMQGYKQYYDDRTIDLVNSTWKDDISLYGFDFDKLYIGNEKDYLIGDLQQRKNDVKYSMADGKILRV
jgi:hypothetical protein